MEQVLSDSAVQEDAELEILFHFRIFFNFIAYHFLNFKQFVKVNFIC